MSSGPGSWLFPDSEGCPEQLTPSPKSLQERIPTKSHLVVTSGHPLSCQGCLFMSHQKLPLHRCSPPQLKEGEDKLALAGGGGGVRAGETGSHGWGVVLIACFHLHTPCTLTTHTFLAHPVPSPQSQCLLPPTHRIPSISSPSAISVALEEPLPGWGEQGWDGWV